MEHVVWLTVALPLVALGMTAFNAVAWPRGRRTGTIPPTSVLIPARNEEATIGATVRSALAEPVDEVIVYDDQSTDATPRILLDIAAEDARVRILAGVPLPDGWVGKPHACHRLAEAARGSLLLFVDADVELAPGAVSRIGSLLEDYDADVVTAVPRQQVGSLVERLVVPLLHVTYASWLPLPLVWAAHDPRFLAANGQVLAVRRTAYDDAGGFARVRDAVVDDMAFCAEQKRAGHRVVFADGHHIATCRMYTSAREVWAGFSKNIFEGVGSVPGLLLVLALYLGAFVWPLVAVAVGGAWFVPGLVGVGANLAQRSLLAVRHGHPAISVVFAPIAVLVLCAIAVNSWVWHARDAIVWSGRSYVRKEARGG